MYVTTVTATSIGSSTKTFTAVNLGSVSSSRLVVLGIGFPDGPNITVNSVTIGGVSATQEAATSNGGTSHNEIWAAPVPIGTTGDIVITCSGTFNTVFVSVYRLDPTSNTPYDTNTANGVINGTLSTTVNIPTNGYMVGSCTLGSGATVTWAGATDNYDAPSSGGFSSADFSSVIAVTPQTVSVTDTSIARVALAVASWAIAPVTVDVTLSEVATAADAIDAFIIHNLALTEAASATDSISAGAPVHNFSLTEQASALDAFGTLISPSHYGQPRRSYTRWDRDEWGRLTPGLGYH